MLLFGGGLPQLAKLAGDAKSYAERLFDYPPIGPLDPESAKRAVAAPAERDGVRYTDEALNYIIEQTGRYPFFLQVWGTHCWDLAPASPITLAHAKQASERAIAALDESIFKVRLARLTERQKAYARAMAELGAGPASSSEVARMLGLNVAQSAPIRDELIRKGMAYSPEAGSSVSRCRSLTNTCAAPCPTRRRRNRRRRKPSSRSAEPCAAFHGSH